MSIKSLLKRPYNLLLSALFAASCIGVMLVFDHLKETETREFEQTRYTALADSMRAEIKTAIDQKHNATLATAMSLSQSSNIKAFLKDTAQLDPSLQELSLYLKEHTTYKNVWLHIIDKEGYSRQRSWSKLTGDNVRDVRADVKDFLQNPRIKSTISVGRFDMTFKSMVPIYDKGDFLGIFEIITHFNSIDRQLQQKGYRSVVLAHKRYKDHLSRPFTETFIQDYYVANLDAPQQLLDLLDQDSMEEFAASDKPYFIVDDYLLSVSHIPNANGSDLGYYFAFAPLDGIDKAGLQNTKNVLTLYSFAVVLFLLLLYVLLLDKKRLSASLSKRSYKHRLTLGLGLFFVLFAALFYILYHAYIQNKIERFLEQNADTTQKLYNMAQDRHRHLAQNIFDTAVNTNRVKKIIAGRHKDPDAARETLHEHLNDKYIRFVSYNIKQLHFHLPNTQSFLRMHRPDKHSDLLDNYRDTVSWISKNQRFIEGFEEGRIYNGYRFVFPLFYDGQFLASVEISFDIYSLMKPLIETFDRKGAFFIEEDTVAKKLQSDERQNYIQSPVAGFLYQKSLHNTLKNTRQNTHFCQKSINMLQERFQNRRDKKAFSISVCGQNTIMNVIPVTNPITEKVVGYSVFAQSSDYIAATKRTFYAIYISITLLVLFLVVFIYRELRTRNALRQLNKNLETKVKFEVGKNMKKDRFIAQQAKLAAMGEMIGAIAHQWRQPLNALNINIQNLEDDYEEGLIDEAFINQFIARQTKTIKFMSKTIDDFRSFFRVDKTKSEFSLQDTIANTEGILEAQLKNHNITLEVDCNTDIILLGYKSEFQQVLLNIINNAKDAILQQQVQNGRITVTCGQNSLQIADNAGGIQEEILEKIFEPYFTTKNEKNGTGMGLYMSKMIIEQNMHERLSVYNSGEGAVFVITYEDARVRG